jgi:hypothetical protein
MLCHQCGISQGLISPHPDETLNLTGTTYKYDKYMKHTAPHNQPGFISVFDDPTYEAYRNYYINASYSGCVEIDDNNRVNIVWYAGEENGVSEDEGVPIINTDSVKIVLFDDRNRVHCYPVASGTTLAATSCELCGSPVVPG